MASLMNCKPHHTSVEMIRAVEDAPHNILTGELRSTRYKEILATRRRKLPVAQSLHQAAFLKNLHENQVTIFVAETGSGKTTQIPQLVMYDCIPAELGRNQQKIACTQPRRLAASSVATRVAAELDTQIGEEVGYMFRGTNKTSGKTILQFMTDGLLLSKAMRDPSFSEFACIIIDEAHERTTATDILMGLLKQALRIRPDFKVVIMSATLDSDVLAAYFPNAVTQKVAGNVYDVECFYLPKPRKDLINAVVETVIHIHLNQDFGDILVFASGLSMINEIRKRIMREMARYESEKSLIGQLVCYELHGKQARDVQEFVVDCPAPVTKHNQTPSRKVVIATNIAEASLTIDGVVYIVDSGSHKMKVFDPRSDAYHFQEVLISKAQAEQRKGRGGRTCPGKCYRMCTQTGFEVDFPAQTIPSIMLGSMTKDTLRMATMGTSVLDFDFVQSPAPESAKRAFQELYHLDLMKTDGKSAAAGNTIVWFPVDPHKAVALISGDRLGCSKEITGILAMLDAIDGNSLWVVPSTPQRQNRLRYIQAKFAHPRGDHLTLLNVYQAWSIAADKREFCEEKMLMLNTLKHADQIRDQLAEKMNAAGLPVKSLALDDLTYYPKILRALCCGYFMRSAVRPHSERQYEYHTLNGQQDASISKFGSMCGSLASTAWVIYEECCIVNGKGQLSTVTAVNPEWLVEARPAYWRPEVILKGPVKEALIEVLTRMTGVSDELFRD